MGPYFKEDNLNPEESALMAWHLVFHNHLLIAPLSASKTASLQSERGGLRFCSVLWKKALVFLFLARINGLPMKEGELREERGMRDPYLPVHKRKHDPQREQAQHGPPTHAMDADCGLWRKAGQNHSFMTHLGPPLFWTWDKIQSYWLHH